MKISELIPLIEHLIEDRGDLTVAVEREGTLYPAEELVVGQASIDDFVEERTAVAYIF